MIRERSYSGSVVQCRRAVSCLQPACWKPFVRLQTFSGDHVQADWINSGQGAADRARRRLYYFLATLSYPRVPNLESFFDQTLENFVNALVRTLKNFGGQPRVKLQGQSHERRAWGRRGDQIHFHPLPLELCAFYHFIARPCQVPRPRLKRACGACHPLSLRVLRERVGLEPPCPIGTREAFLCRDQVVHQRPWPRDDRRKVLETLAEE